ncbi:MAG: SDR family NAD(P)-dependent oxidoreductase [Rhodospirillales bacterium]|nr:SDR family NAD(P)-dependent oxidoreductase [Rhodospirillales bacterium]
MECRATAKRHYRRALITGATSGIGAAFAAALPPTTDLLLSARSEEQLAQARDTLAQPGREIEIAPADLRQPDAVAALVERAEAFAIDLLINNAGTGQIGAVLDHTLEAETAAAMVNVVAKVALTRSLLPGMIERAKCDGSSAGVIILSSAAAFAPVPYFTTYAATKAFCLHYGEGLAEELRGEPVSVLVVCPGATRTAFGGRAGYGGEMPCASEPEDVARKALAALGRQTVVVTGALSPVALSPLLGPRRLFTGALGAGMRMVAGRAQR